MKVIDDLGKGSAVCKNFIILQNDSWFEDEWTPKQREIIMSTINSYWKYKTSTGIIVEYEDDCVGAFYLLQGDMVWKKVTEWDVVQWP